MSISVVGGNVDKLRSSSRASSLLLLPRDKSEFRAGVQRSKSKSYKFPFDVSLYTRFLAYVGIELYTESMKLNHAWVVPSFFCM